MKTCAACRKEVLDEANFCGWCGFRLTPISSSDLDTLTKEIQPIEEVNPILLTKMKAVQGKGEEAWRKRQKTKEREGASPEEQAAPPPRLEVVDEGIRARRPSEPVQLVPPPVPADAVEPAETVEPPTIVLDRPKTKPPVARQESPEEVAVAPTIQHPAMLQPDEPPDYPPSLESGAYPQPKPPPVPADARVPPQTEPPVRMPTVTPPAPRTRQPTPQPVRPPPPTPLPENAPQPTPEAAEDNERECKRFPLKVEVGYASEHNFYTGFMENLSSGGLFVATHNPADLGDVIEVTFTVPALRRNCTAMCLVQWTRAYDSSMPDMIPGMGLKFVKLDADARAAVEMFIKHREPIFYE